MMKGVAQTINERKRRVENIYFIGKWRRSVDNWEVRICMSGSLLYRLFGSLFYRLSGRLLSVALSIILSVWLYVVLSVELSVVLSVCLFIYPWN